MARTRPQEYWQDEALPDVRAFRRHPTDIRKAQRAALQTFHMHDYVWETYHDSAPAKIFHQTDNAKQYKLYLRNNEPEGGDFHLIEDVANSKKHMKLRDQSHIVASVRSVYRVSPDSRIWSWLPASLVGYIEVELEDGTKKPFAPALENVVAMWERLITRDGL